MSQAMILEKPELETDLEECHVFPTTPAQRRFWEYDQDDPGNPAYNIAIRMRLSGHLEVASLLRAANEVIRRHEMLRTVFAEENGVPVQVVHPTLTIPLAQVDLRSLSEERKLARLEEISIEEARKRFSIVAGPLIRMRLLRIADAEHILLVTVHQTVSDCWSIGMISHEIGTLYGAFSRGQSSPLADLTIQYGDYAVWHEEWMATSKLDAQRIYWSRQLADLPPLEIPPDRKRPARRTSNGHIQSVVLPKNFTEALKDLSHREGCTFFMLSLAALKVLMHRLTGQRDLYVGTITAGRSRVEMEPLIGRFINPLVIRTKLSGDPTFLELLADVRERVLEALDNRDIPYECVVEALAPPKDPSRHPVFQVNFVHQRAFVRPLELQGLSLTGIPSKSAGAIYDLYFFMVERAEGWRLSCEYNTDLYEASTVEQMLVAFQNILQRVVDEPTVRLQELTRAAVGTTVIQNSKSIPVRALGAADASHASDRVAVEPRDDIERRLAKLWAEVTGVKKVSVNSDFFDDGGHSVLAARMLYLIEKDFGRELSLGAFLRDRTIEKLALRLRTDESCDEGDQICTIQRGGGRLPLIVVDAGYRFVPLAEKLGADQPVIGLMLPSLSKLPQRFTVEDIAANLLPTLKQIQPTGPYYLAGWCAAGIIAYELAQLLRAEGSEVAFVALFDSWNPEYSRELKSLKGLRRKIAMRLHRYAFHLRATSKLSLIEMCRYGLKCLGSFRNQLRVRFWRLWYRTLNRPATGRLRHEGQFKNLAAAEYRPVPIDVPLVVYRADRYQGCRAVDPEYGWGSCGRRGVRVRDLTGDHGAMLFDEPHLSVTAQYLAADLSKL